MILIEWVPVVVVLAIATVEIVSVSIGRTPIDINHIVKKHVYRKIQIPYFPIDSYWGSIASVISLCLHSGMGLSQDDFGGPGHPGWPGRWGRVYKSNLANNPKK